MRTVWLDCVEYKACWQLQQELAELRLAGKMGDVLLLLEHPPTITLGRGADVGNVLASSEQLEAAGVAVRQIDRGGDVTFHGPGQLVGYPIVNLCDHRQDLHWFLREIEEALIAAVAEFGITGRRFAPHTGVWVGDEKLAAIGIKVSRWVTTHGFALNVDMDMRAFDFIVPCGIAEYGVTSLRKGTGKPITVEEVLVPISRAFSKRFHGADTAWDGLPEGLSDGSKKIFEKALDVAESLC